MSVLRGDVVVVGAGPAGLGAALETSRLGLRTVVIDERPAIGGRVPAQGAGLSGGPSGAAWLAGVRAQVEAGATRFVLGRSVWSVSPAWRVLTAPVDPTADVDPWEIEARALVLATGATEQPIPLPGWTLPGVVTAGAAQTLLRVHHVLVGSRVALVGVNATSLELARDLAAAGAEVVGIVEGSPWPTGTADARTDPASLVADAGTLGIAVHAGGRAERVVRLGGALGLSISSGRADAPEQTWEVDAVVLCGRTVPLTDAAQLAGCPVAFVPERGAFVPLHGPSQETPVPGLFVAGAVAGIDGRDAALAQGRLAGLAGARLLGAAARDIEATLRHAHAALDEAVAAGEAREPGGIAVQARLASLWQAQAIGRAGT